MASPPVTDVTHEQIAALVLAHKGNLAAVAGDLGVARSWVHNRVMADEQLKSVLHDAREALIDKAECQLEKNIAEGKEASLIFYLKTQGYKRGYGRQGNYDPDNPNATQGTQIIVVDRRAENGNDTAE